MDQLPLPLSFSLNTVVCVHCKIARWIFVLFMRWWFWINQENRRIMSIHSINYFSIIMWCIFSTILPWDFSQYQMKLKWWARQMDFLLLLHATMFTVLHIYCIHNYSKGRLLFCGRCAILAVANNGACNVGKSKASIIGRKNGKRCLCVCMCLCGRVIMCTKNAESFFFCGPIQSRCPTHSVVFNLLYYFCRTMILFFSFSDMQNKHNHQ